MGVRARQIHLKLNTIEANATKRALSFVLGNMVNIQVSLGGRRGEQALASAKEKLDLAINMAMS